MVDDPGSIKLILSFIAINLPFAPDNAAFILLAVHKLSECQAKIAINIGIIGAVVFRGIFAVPIQALNHKFCLPIGIIGAGIIVILIVIFKDRKIQAKDSIQKVVVAIILADALLSFDNIIALVNKASSMVALLIGVAINIPILFAAVIAGRKFQENYPVLLKILAVSALIGIGVDLVICDPWLNTVIDLREFKFLGWVAGIAALIVQFFVKTEKLEQEISKCPFRIIKIVFNQL